MPAFPTISRPTSSSRPPTRSASRSASTSVRTRTLRTTSRATSWKLKWKLGESLPSSFSTSVSVQFMQLKSLGRFGLPFGSVCRISAHHQLCPRPSSVPSPLDVTVRPAHDWHFGVWYQVLKSASSTTIPSNADSTMTLGFLF